MCCYELIETIAISITALLAIVTLILNIIKETYKYYYCKRKTT